MQENSTPKIKNTPPTETVTYRMGSRSFIVQPVFREDAKNTLVAILLRLMQAELERKS